MFTMHRRFIILSASIARSGSWCTPFAHCHIRVRRQHTQTARSVLDLKGYRCVVTGASGAIGFSIAHSFALSGASVLLISRTESKLSSRVDEIRSAVQTQDPDQDIKSAAGDVTDATFLEKVSKGQEWCDILVNAAGVSQNKLLFRTSPAELQNVVDTNLIGTMLACKYFGKKMTKQNVKTRPEGPLTGCIVNVGSVLGHFGGKGAVAYASSKAGITALTRSLAGEFTSLGIRVNAVLPGYIESEMTKDLPNLAHIIKQIPSGRLGKPEEVADAVLFLATNQYANNCVLNLDGGISANGS